MRISFGYSYGFNTKNTNTAHVNARKGKTSKIPTICVTARPSKYSDDFVFSVIEAYGQGNPINSILATFDITKGCLEGWITGLNRQHILRMYEAKYGPLEPRIRGRPKK